MRDNAEVPQRLENANELNNFAFIPGEGFLTGVH
jgi:hypothetical protein